MPILHASAACPCFMSVLHIYVSMLLFHTEFPHWMSMSTSCRAMLHVRAVCLCCMNIKMKLTQEEKMLLVHASCPFCTSILHANSICSCFMSMLHAMSPCCMSMSMLLVRSSAS
jgi:hypothetical protein